MPHLRQAVCSVFARVGSRHEQSNNGGVTHLLEHLFFRGSRRFRDSRRMNARVEAVGGNLNAATMRDLSTFFSPCHPSGVATVLTVLGDMLSRPRLPDIEIEKRVIVEEMLDEVDDEGRDIDVENLSKRALYTKNPLSYKIAGTIESVKRLTLADVNAHFRRFYVSRNLAVVVAGPVEHKQMVSFSQQAFRYLPIGPRATEQTPRGAIGSKLTFVHMPEPQIEFRYAFPAVSEFHEDGVALLMLRRMLDDGLSSTLPYEIVERRGLAYSIAATHDSFVDAGSFDIDGACSPSNFSALSAALGTILKTAKTKRIAPSALRVLRERTSMQFEFMKDNANEMIGWFGGQVLFRRPKPFRTRERELLEVTAEDIRQVAIRYLTPKHLQLIAVGPRKSKPVLQQALSTLRRKL
jgi:predicted Zn-dependent peptidase